MARGALRGMAGGVLTLVVLQGLTGKGAGRVADLIDTTNGLVSRVLDPLVPAIPDRSSTPTAAEAAAAATAAQTVAPDAPRDPRSIPVPKP